MLKQTEHAYLKQSIKKQPNQKGDFKLIKILQKMLISRKKLSHLNFLHQKICISQKILQKFKNKKKGLLMMHKLLNNKQDNLIIERSFYNLIRRIKLAMRHLNKMYKTLLLKVSSFKLMTIFLSKKINTTMISMNHQ